MNKGEIKNLKRSLLLVFLGVWVWAVWTYLPVLTMNTRLDFSGATVKTEAKG